MYDVLNICRYVIIYSNKRSYGVSNLKLQKLLYLIQASFLINKPYKACFHEKIEAWDFGPVVPVAYHEYKQYASSDIPDQVAKTYYVIGKNLWDIKRYTFNDKMIKRRDKKLIRAVVDKFADYTATDLVSLTHRQQPWINAYKNNVPTEITVKALKDYFVERCEQN